MPNPPHDCPGGCGSTVAYSRLACRACWWRLPVELRGEVTAGYEARTRNPRAHRDALIGALAWYRTNPRSVQL